MKKLLLLSTLFLCGQVTAQCVKLYVKEHLSGSPICNLSSGDWIEICEQSNEVNGCPRNFYIFSKGSSSGSLTYELSLDRGWSTHYMTLMVNPSTKRFGFILQGQTALYSYYTEKERKIEIEASNKRAEQWNKEKVNSDAKKYAEINTSLRIKDLNTAATLISQLHFPRSYPKYEDFQKLLKERQLNEDVLLTSRIDSLIKSKNAEEAALLFAKYNYPVDEVRVRILNSLTDFVQNEKIQQLIDPQDLKKFIQNNKNSIHLSELSIGSNEIIFTPSGLVKINGKVTDLDEIVQYKNYGKNNAFKVPIEGSGNLSVTVKSEKIGKPYFAVSTDKKVYKRWNDDNYFTIGFFKTSLSLYAAMDEYGHTKTKTINQLQIPEKEIWTIQDLKETKYIANELIHESSAIKREVLDKKKFKYFVSTIVLDEKYAYAYGVDCQCKALLVRLE